MGNIILVHSEGKMEFHKLIRHGNEMSITHKKPFDTESKAFKPETIKRVFDFAYDMTFGNKGAHRVHRTGGTINRKQGEIFSNTFQGKLAECAACNLLYKVDKKVFPDFSVSKLGVWDSVDVIVKDKKIAVKSTKSFGNLLLLEQQDWDINGNYIPNRETGSSTYDYFLLVRIQPFCEDILRRKRWLYNDTIDRDVLWEAVSQNTWLYDFGGYITLDDLRFIIKNEFVIHKGDILNGGTRMDATNYYVQSGDMSTVSQLVEELQPTPKEEKVEIEHHNDNEIIESRGFIKKFLQRIFKKN